MQIEQKIQKNVPLAPFTTYKIGGPAKYYLEAAIREDLSGAFAWAIEQGIKVYVLGGGSNVLIPDRGVDGLVIRLANNDIAIKGERVECGAGAMLASIINKAKGNKLSGLEWASGIPRATVGGAIRGNAEAFNCPMSGLVETVEVYDKIKDKFVIYSNRECQFAYRMSIFKKTPDLLVWQAVLRMRSEDSDKIARLVEESLDFRGAHYPKLPGAGSIFENIDPDYFKKQNPAFFENELEGRVGQSGRISAGLLIDKLDLKGKTIGGAKVSLEHANHIINTGRAKAEEVLMLISYIKQQVRDNYNIQIKEEIQYFGFE